MVVLPTKCYVAGDARERTRQSLTSLIANDIGSLDVSFEVTVREDDFVDVTLAGEDATAAGNLLQEKWGTIGPVSDGETATGTLESWDGDGFVLDSTEQVHVGADDIGLGPGDPGQIRERFGLVQHIPLQYVAGQSPRLAEAERDRLYDWRRGEGRVNVNSATRAEVRATVNRAGHAQDIVTVERLGALEQSIVCRPGTDPPGLLASIGEYLPAELLCVRSQ